MDLCRRRERSGLRGCNKRYYLSAPTEAYQAPSLYGGVLFLDIFEDGGDLGCGLWWCCRSLKEVA